MQFSIKRRIVQLVQGRLHALVVFSLLVLAIVGRVPDSQAGWITCPAQVVMVAPEGRRQQYSHLGRGRADRGAACWRTLLRTWHIPFLRSLLLWGLWYLSGQQGPAWVSLVPWGLWLWQRAGLLWPWLRRQPEWQGGNWLGWQAQRWLMVGYLGLTLGTLLRRGTQVTFPPPRLGALDENQGSWTLGLGCVVCGRPEPWAEVVPEEDGSYTATLCGHFTLQVAGDHPFRVRMLMLFLRLLEVAGPQRGGRRTREGRTPFVPQQQLAAWFQMPQPDISRVEKYWLEAQCR